MSTTTANAIFVAKATFAALLALTLAMWMELGMPSIAMFSVLVVMQPNTGFVLAKSFARMAGTIGGCAAALVIVALTAQHPLLLITGLATWVGLCAAGATRYRHFSPYAFVLAGYMACIVVMPVVDQPEGALDMALFHLENIALGIFCAGTVSALFFPVTSNQRLQTILEERFDQTITTLRKLLYTHDRIELSQQLLNLNLQIVEFETYTGMSSLEEPEIIQRRARFRLMNERFMEFVSRIHAIHMLLSRTPPQGLLSSVLRQLIEDVIISLEDMLLAGQKEGRFAWDKTHLTQLRKTFMRHSLMHRDRFCTSHELLTHYDTAAELIHDALTTFESYVETHQGIDVPQSPWHKSLPFYTATGRVLPWINGLRAFMTVVVLGLFWKLAQWPSGNTACMFGAMAVSLIGISPSQRNAAPQALLAGFLVVGATIIYDIYLLPQITDLIPLWIVSIPFVALGPYLIVRGRWVVAGWLYNLFFGFVAGPSNPMLHFPENLLNTLLSFLAGVFMAVGTFYLVFPVNGQWLRKHALQELKNQIIGACTGDLRHWFRRFDSSTRDITHNLMHSMFSEKEDKSALAWWSISAIEIGHTALCLRVTALLLGDHYVMSAIENILTSVAMIFKKGRKETRNAALKTIEQFTTRIEENLTQSSLDLDHRHSLRKVRSYLHFLRSALLDIEFSQKEWSYAL